MTSLITVMTSSWLIASMTQASLTGCCVDVLIWNCVLIFKPLSYLWQVCVFKNNWQSTQHFFLKHHLQIHNVGLRRRRLQHLQSFSIDMFVVICFYQSTAMHRKNEYNTLARLVTFVGFLKKLLNECEISRWNKLTLSRWSCRVGQETGPVWALITQQWLVVESHVIRQKFQNAAKNKRQICI